MSIADSPRRKGDKRDRTRAALIAATLEVLAEKGFAGASNQAIAARAGMTKGAIYSNFTSKAELLLAALGAKGLTLSSPRPAGATVADELAAMADDLARMLPRAQGEARFLAEFQLYALNDPELREGLATAYSDAFGRTAGYLATLAGPTPAMAPRELAVALQAVGLGMMMQSFITPGEVTDDVIRRTLAALARGLAA